MHNSIFIHIFLILALTASNCHARWAKYEDAIGEIISSNLEITVNPDGSSRDITTTHVKILKEQGVRKWANFYLTYNSDNEEIKILSAKTIIGGKEFLIDPKSIEDKPLASAPNGFDQHNQILLAFPKLEIGAEIYLQFEKITKTPVLDNYFSNAISYSGFEYWHNSQVSLKSAMPLFIEVNDPNKNLKVTQQPNKQGGTDINIVQVKPIIEMTIEDLGVLNQNKYTWVAVSSLNKWTEYASKFRKKYQDVINQDLPKLFRDIVELAHVEKNDVDIINIVTSNLAQKVQYMGDWRSVKGRYFPHNLEHIAKTGLGDCKDYSVATAAMLKSLGFKVSAAFVMRGEGLPEVKFYLPSINHFNHAILRAEKNGKKYWLDPTNFVSMASGIFPDIAGKNSILLNIENEEVYQRIPEINATHNQTVINETWNFEQAGMIANTGTMNLYGEMAYNITGAQLNASDERIKEYIFSIIGDNSLSAEKEIMIPNLSSRLVKDLEFKFAIKQPSIPVNSNTGIGIKLSALPSIFNYTNINTNIISDIYVSPQRTITNIVTIKNFDADLQASNLDVNIVTPWVDISRIVTQKEDDIIVTDKAIVKKSYISNEEFNSPIYKALQEQINSKLRHVVLIRKAPNLSQRHQTK